MDKRRMKSLDYRRSGVDIKAAESFLGDIKKFMPKNTGMAAFASFLKADFLKKMKNPYIVSSCDGVGTKLKIAQDYDVHGTVGVDLVAMSVNDIICCGAKPLFFLDYIACGNIERDVLREVVESISAGLKESNCLLLGGETAEMPGMYKKGEYDLAGFCVGAVDRKNIIDGKKIKSGDVVIGMASSGLHSNGFSLARKSLGRRLIKKYLNILLEPTRIYVKSILSFISESGKSGINVKGIAHVTGGAFYNKITKILPDGLGFLLDKDSWPVPDIFGFIQRQGGISDKEMYSVFNMGIGMIVVVGSEDADRSLKILNKFTESFVIGEVAKAKKKVTFV